MTDARDTIKVTIDEKFQIDKALRKFKRLCEAYGIVKEYRRRQSYAKPSVRAKEKKESALKRRLKTNTKSTYNRYEE